MLKNPRLWYFYRKNLISYLKLDTAPLARPAWSLDLEHSLPVGVLHGKPGPDEGAVLFDPADGGAGRRLDLNLLEAAETDTTCAPEGTN
jgi:hypothetical protein